MKAGLGSFGPKRGWMAKGTGWNAAGGGGRGRKGAGAWVAGAKAVIKKCPIHLKPFINNIYAMFIRPGALVREQPAYIQPPAFNVQRFLSAIHGLSIVPPLGMAEKNLKNMAKELLQPQRTPLHLLEETMDLATLSALGASAVNPVNLISLLNTSSGTDTNPISSVLDNQADTLSISSQGQWTSRAQSSNPFKTDFDQLGKLIASGDLAGAKKAFAAMQAKMKAHKQGGDDPMAADFEALGKALASGDADAASAAYKTMQTDLQSLQASASASGTQGADPFKTDFDNLGKLIAAGDLSGAKTALAAMQTKMKAHGPKQSEDGDDPMAAAFDALSKALDSGDTASATSAFNTLQTKLQKAPPSGGTGSSASNTSTANSELEAQLLAAYLKSSTTGTTSLLSPALFTADNGIL